MRIYGNPASTCTRKVLTVFAEKNVKPDFVVIDFAKGEHKAPEHLARHPFGQVPTLDDGFTLYESRAICRYLDERLDGPKLVPSDLKARAMMEQWISVETSNFTPSAMKIIYAAYFNPAWYQKPVDQLKLEEGRTGLAPTLDVMEKQLSKTPFIAGSDFTLADISFMPYVEYLFAAKQGNMIESRPSLAKWWKGVSDRRSWQVATGKAS